ncbi:insulinase family protein [Kitasatospora sp. NPDC008050]|uniref:insulinase family protein n=1 Tax=Kitasatospora sp. NPDC008050 TaxID=3364021 RepID=UPI0036E4BC2B
MHPVSSRPTSRPTSLPTGRALIVDLPYGFADDPPERLGLAALTARHLMHPQADGPGALARERAWHTRHQLLADCSSFAFWSGLDDLAEVVQRFNRTASPDTARLQALVAAQLRLADACLGDPYTQVMDLLEATAWGPDRPSLGTAQTLAAITPQDLREALEASCGDGVRTYGQDDEAAPVRVPQPRAHWRGGRQVREQPGGSAVRVAVALPVTLPAPGAAELAVELLGSHGIGGRLAPALRGDRPLAYGLGALQLSRPGAGALGAHAQVAPEHAHEALRILLDTLRTVLREPVPEPERQAAAARLRTALLLQADQPFGAVDELRRRSRGETELAALAAAVRERADDGVLPVEVTSGQPALVAVGAVSADLLEGWTAA